MTYGWAIVIIGVAMVLLWQWGFFNPTGQVKFSTLGFWGVMPTDAKYTSDGSLSLSVRNEIVDGDVDITGLQVKSGGVTYNTESSFNQTIVSGGILTIPLDHSVTQLPGGGEGAAYDLQVAITYVDHRLDSTEYSFISSGNIQGSIEKA